MAEVCQVELHLNQFLFIAPPDCYIRELDMPVLALWITENLYTVAPIRNCSSTSKK